MNNEVLKNISYGVYVISTFDDKKSTGCIANSVIQVAQDIIAISINHQNYTNECIKNSKKFAISILPIDIDENVIPTFGFQSGRTVDKFKEIEKINIDGIDIIKNSIGYIICEVVNVIEAKTHSVFLAKIKDMEMLEEKTPMTYAYYHNIKKGKSPKAAPTYIEEKNDVDELAYKCSVCGYIYKGDINKETDDYVCPICKQAKSVFIKL